MNLPEDTYVPALRWRQGEYQALFRLSASIKDHVVPFITIPPVEFNFELWQPSKSVHEHVHPFVVSLHRKWGSRPAWIALDPTIAAARMDNGSHVFEYIFDGIRPLGCFGIPSLPLSSDAAAIEAVSHAVEKDNQGAAINIRLEDLMVPDPQVPILDLVKRIGVGVEEVDLILDLQAPNFQPYDAFATALITSFSRMESLMNFRNFVLIGTAFPETSTSYSKGTDEIPRHDWLFYKALVDQLPKSLRRPNFGDHTIVHPAFTAMDMRKVKPAGKVIYTKPDAWATRKGGSFRDDREQMHDHCRIIVDDPEFAFRGANFSYGDKFISDCANEIAGPSNLSRWKDVGINHHITTVVDDLANFCATTSPV